MKLMTQLAEFVIPLFVLGLGLTPSLRAGLSNKETKVTLTEAVRIPGRILPAGHYIFRMPTELTERNVVEIFSADTNRFITLVFGVPDYRPDHKDQPVIDLEKRPGDALASIQSWFYPGDNYGLDFQYPQAKHKL